MYGLETLGPYVWVNGVPGGIDAYVVTTGSALLVEGIPTSPRVEEAQEEQLILIIFNRKIKKIIKYAFSTRAVKARDG
jgi:hypothetical protein